MLPRDNVPAQNALSNRQFLAENIVMLEQSLYSPDLALCKFLYFHKLKRVIKKIRFKDVDNIKNFMMTEVKKISEELFQECMQAWKRKMRNCIRF